MSESFSNPCNEVVAALGKVQAALGGTLRATRQVNAGSRKYSYIELDAILTAALPELEANGLTVFHTQDGGGTDCYVMHTSGQWIRSHAHVVVDDKMSAQDVGSAFTYARRYSLTAVFALAAGDDDGQAATDARKKKKEAEPEPEPQPTTYVQWSDQDAESKFAADLAAAGVTKTYGELMEMCAKADKPPPHKMEDEQLKRFKAYVIREYGKK